MEKSKDNKKGEKNSDIEDAKKVYEQFLIDIKQTFRGFDFSNMDKNASSMDFDETNLRQPVAYNPEYNTVILSTNLEDKYKGPEIKHPIYHELVHMATTKRAKTANPKTGFGVFIWGPIIAKRIAITEGMTEYITERIIGKEKDMAYLFEKRCAKSLCEIFGDEVIQDFLDADEKSLYNRAEKYGITKKEMNELFSDMDKSLMWRNNCVYAMKKGKKVKGKNEHIANIEQKLVNMSARVALERGASKEEIAEKIDKIKQNFIPIGLKFDIADRKEENFLSEYSEDLEKAIQNADQIKNEIFMGRITSSQQLVTPNKSVKEKLSDLFKIKRSNKDVALPSSDINSYEINQDTGSQIDKKTFIAELENLKNSPELVEAVEKDEKQVQVKEEKTI